MDPVYGWIWVPGDEWAPAWVSWHYGDGYVGWAPLPPRARWTGVGLDLADEDLDVEIAASAYTFVPERRFVDVPIRGYAVPIARNRELIRVTRNHTAYAVAGGAVVNRGVPVQVIERETRRKVPHFQFREAPADSPGRARIQGREVRLFRPAVRVTPEVVRRHEEQRASARGGPLRRQQREQAVRERQAEAQRESERRRQQAATQQAEARAQREHAAHERALADQQRQEREGEAARLRQQSRENQRRAEQELRERQRQAATERNAELRRDAEGKRQAQAREQASVREQARAKQHAAQQEQRAQREQQRQQQEQQRAQQQQERAKQRRQRQKPPQSPPPERP
jgi:hypothetical protein